MNLDAAHIYTYSLPLQKAFNIKGTKLSQREGIILRVTSEEHEGFAEIAPLPGLSIETFEEALSQIRSLIPYLLDTPLPKNIHHLNGGFKTFFDELTLHPSVQCGIESAILNLFSNKLHKPLSKIIGHASHDNIRITGLLQGTTEEVVNQSKQLIKSGFTALKLKVGNNIEKEIPKVLSINKVIEGKALLHLDANQTWDMDMATKLADEVGLKTLDYIEEPFKDLSLISEFYLKTSIPLALDESLKDLDLEQIRKLEGVYFLILKPMHLGGIEKAWEMMQQAKGVGIDTVISSCFESSIGIWALANLAGCHPRDNAAGLDTLKYFDQDLLNHPLEIQKGKMPIRKKGIKREDINFNLLTEVA